MRPLINRYLASDRTESGSQDARSLRTVTDRLGRVVSIIIAAALAGFVVIAVVVAGSQTLLPSSVGVVASPLADSQSLQPSVQASTLIASSAPTPVFTPSAAGLSEDEAVATARTFLPQAQSAAADVWATRAGSFVDVFSVARRPTHVEQPIPDDVAPGRMVWAVQFKLPIELCGPGASDCQDRMVLRTIFIDFSSGEFLRASTFGPAPGEPLPTPG
jgi:hypothetical protein